MCDNFVHLYHLFTTDNYDFTLFCLYPIATVHPSSIMLSIIEMTTSPSIAVMLDPAQSTSTVIINDI